MKSENRARHLTDPEKKVLTDCLARHNCKLLGCIEGFESRGIDAVTLEKIIDAVAVEFLERVPTYPAGRAKDGLELERLMDKLVHIHPNLPAPDAQPVTIASMAWFFEPESVSQSS
jgi:hypothetical protein